MKIGKKSLAIAASIALAISLSAAPASHAAGSIPANPKIIVLGGALSDSFWNAVNKGVQDAAKTIKATGGTVVYLGPKDYSNFGPDMARLTQSALAQKPAAVASPNWIPASQSPEIAKIVRAGIPFFSYNTGPQQAVTDKAVGYVGSDEEEAGKAAGEAMVKSGAKNIACINQTPGAQNLETRCAGVKAAAEKAGVKYQILQVPAEQATDAAAFTQSVKAFLLTNKDIDGVVLLNAGNATWASEAIKAAGSKAKLGTFDIDSNNLKRVVAGTQLFCIDQQPYLQGFMITMRAYQLAKWGLQPATKTILTGPLVIGKGEAALALAGAKAGVRGAS